MSLAKLAAVSLVMLISSLSNHQYQVSSFWLTDMTMFQQPIGISTNNKLTPQQQQQDVINNSNLAEISQDLNPTKPTTIVEERNSSPPKAPVTYATPRIAKVVAKDEKVSFVDNKIGSINIQKLTHFGKVLRKHT